MTREAYSAGFKLHASGSDDTLDVGMPIDISDVLHVLAHELRTPSGIAQGYLRMLLEDRLTTESDRRRALEQAQHALARVSQLSHESSRLADWYDRETERRAGEVDARALIERAIADAALEPAPLARVDLAPGSARVSSLDHAMLTSALSSLLKATARELQKQPCVIAAGRNGNVAVDILIGGDDQLPTLGRGPSAASAGALALERGGLGLSLVLAAAVFDAHRAVLWTVGGARSAVGIRLALKEGADQ